MRSRIKARRKNRRLFPNTAPAAIADAAAPNDAPPHGVFSTALSSGAVAPENGDRREGCGECADCLWQAEICCEQAREAARLKRLHAACGLFATAQSLLKRAIASSGDLCAEACEDAREKLKNITSEMATYSDLAKSAARPMHILHATLATNPTLANDQNSPSPSRAQSNGLAP